MDANDTQVMTVGAVVSNGFATGEVIAVRVQVARVMAETVATVRWSSGLVTANHTARTLRAV